MGNQGFISMGNYKFRSIKLEVRVSGYMDILILNTYPARPLSLSMGKKGQPGTHFNGKYQQGMNLIFQQELQVKLKVGVSGFMDILISNMYSATPLSLSRKEGTTGDSFQWEITIVGLSQWKIFRRS